MIDYFEFTGERTAKKVREKLATLSKNNEIENLKQYLVDNGADFTKDLFIDFFQQELAERKSSKQDYTPPELADLMFDLLPNSDQYFDPTGGTGSLLIKAMNSGKEVYYNELDEEACAFAKLNALLRGVDISNFKTGDALDIKENNFDAIIANPPYSISYNPDDFEFDLFNKAGARAPKSKADYAFIAMILDNLSENGTAVVLLPHGVLFRGQAEGKLRKQLIEDNLLDAIIGMPENLFYGTGIPTAILVLKKQRQNRDVLVIDASKNFEKLKNVNRLREQDVKQIVDVYQSRKEVEKYSHNATIQEIIENDYNLNIPRYVDTFEEEAPIDLDKLMLELDAVNQQIQELEGELFDQTGKLIKSDGTPAFDEKQLKTLFFLESAQNKRIELLSRFKKYALKKNAHLGQLRLFDETN